MSSVKKSKVDLLFKVRFQNPLPPPPFPPKLINIPTNPGRYAEPEFISSLASETPLPMVVDAELGMPLDLSHYDCLWDDNVNDSQLNPDPNNLPPVDPGDAFMLGDTTLPSSSGSYSPSPSPASQVSWLRKTEYISSSVNKTATPSQEARRTVEEPAAVDVSIPAQIADIERTFKYAREEFDITKLKHPSKPKLTAVESYEILPDAETWANAYDLFRFSERPGDRPIDIADPRLETAMLRPMESDGDHFLSYYLPKEDAEAEYFIAKRRSGQNTEEETVFSFIRDYETVKIEEDIGNEFVLVIDEGEEEGPQGRREKAAYYKGVERKIVLKKKRANPWDTYADKWDAINLTLRPFEEVESSEREGVLAEVTDPEFGLARPDVDAEGEADVEVQPNAAVDVSMGS